jgi:hypothetical protein
MQMLMTSLAGPYGLMACVALVALLSLQEFVHGAGRLARVAKGGLWCAIVPLTLLFGLAIGIRLAEAL